MKDIISFIKEFNYKKLIFPFIIVILYLLGFAYLFYLYLGISKNDSHIENNLVNDLFTRVSTKEDIEEIKIAKKIYVDIKGYVNKPGVYEIEEGKRVIDVIEVSGGLKKNANTRFINLSKIVSDGDVIVIYSNEEIEKAKEKETIIVEVPCVCEEVKNDACITENKEKEENNNVSIEQNNQSNLVNINKASIEELMSLSGIGESKAKSIVEYRSANGNFKSINDIVNVSGISENLFEKIKDNITV